MLDTMKLLYTTSLFSDSKNNVTVELVDDKNTGSCQETVLLVVVTLSKRQNKHQMVVNICMLFMEPWATEML